VSTRRNAGRAGFTIVEVVLAMGILLLGMTSILGMLTFGAALSRTAQLRNQGAQAAEAVAADLRDGLFPLVLDEETGRHLAGEPAEVRERPVPGRPGLTYSATAVLVPRRDDSQAAALAPELYRVDVELAWKSGGARRTRSFTTLVAREVPFGERMRRLFLTRDLDPLGALRPAIPGDAPAGAPTDETDETP
jgi:type II secretory pathway pseudopilin PulG